MIVGDSSVLVPAFASWHERHEAVLPVVREMTAVIAHAALETYSVLTRLPAPLQAPPGVVATWLERRFTGRWLSLPPEELATLPGWLARADISGGAVYDALIARTAAAAGATLLSLDARAAEHYRRCDVRVDLL